MFSHIDAHFSFFFLSPVPWQSIVKYPGNQTHSPLFWGSLTPYLALLIKWDSRRLGAYETIVFWNIVLFWVVHCPFQPNLVGSLMFFKNFFFFFAWIFFFVACPLNGTEKQRLALRVPAAFLFVLSHPLLLFPDAYACGIYTVVSCAIPNETSVWSEKNSWSEVFHVCSTNSCCFSPITSYCQWRSASFELFVPDVHSIPGKKPFQRRDLLQPRLFVSFSILIHSLALHWGQQHRHN